MTEAAALDKRLIDFLCVSADWDGYPSMAVHPGGISGIPVYEEVISPVLNRREICAGVHFP